jgi:hypothetical protein
VLYLSNADLTTTLQGMVAAGVTWLRVDVDWPTIEGTQGTFIWSTPDRVIDEAVADGLKIDALLSYLPPWAEEPTTGFPNPTDFGQFATAAAKHYSSIGVNTYEIWNEPNLGGNWGGTVSPASYTSVLQAGYTAIKAVQPASTVLTAGLSPAADASNGSQMSPATFLTDMYAAGAHGYFDAVGMHPYSFPYAPMTAASWNPFYELPSIYAIMQANGDGNKQIWSTEISWPTTFPSNPSNAVSDATQATYLTEAFTQLRQWSWAGPMFWYDWSDGQDSTGSYGLVSATFAPKPALAAFTAAVTTTASAPPTTSTTSTTTTTTTTTTTAPPTTTTTSTTTPPTTTTTTAPPTTTTTTTAPPTSTTTTTSTTTPPTTTTTVPPTTTTATPPTRTPTRTPTRRRGRR